MLLVVMVASPGVSSAGGRWMWVYQMQSVVVVVSEAAASGVRWWLRSHQQLLVVVVVVVVCPINVSCCGGGRRPVLLSPPPCSGCSQEIECPNAACNLHYQKRCHDLMHTQRNDGARVLKTLGNKWKYFLRQKPN